MARKEPQRKSFYLPMTITGTSTNPQVLQFRKQSDTFINSSQSSPGKGTNSGITPLRMNNLELDGEMEGEVVEQTALSFPRWNYREIIIHLTMIIYWFKYIFEPACCRFRSNILYLWIPWKELTEILYENNSIVGDFKVMEGSIDNYYQTNEPLFMKMLQEFHFCLGCGYTWWRG